MEPTRYYYLPLVGWFFRKRLAMVLELVAARHHARLLEVAFGGGLFLPSLATGCDSLHGLDLHAGLDVVRENLKALGVEARLSMGDAHRIPYADGSFDCVVNVSMLEHLTDPGMAIDEMLRVLRPGGLLVVGFPCRNPWMDAFFRVAGYDPREVHPSSHRAILRALRDRRPEIRLTTLPRGLAADLSLYCACSVER